MLDLEPLLVLKRHKLSNLVLNFEKEDAMTSVNTENLAYLGKSYLCSCCNSVGTNHYQQARKDQIE